MRRKRKNPKNQEQAEIEVQTDLVAFDDVLNRELVAPTVIDLASESNASAVVPQAPMAPVEIPPTALNGNETIVQDATAEDNAALRAEILGLPVAREPEPLPAKSHLAANTASVGSTGSAGNTAPVGNQLIVHDSSSDELVLSDQFADQIAEQPTEQGSSDATRGAVGFEQFDFWDRYDEATASADLFAVPPAAITVVIGSLDVAIPIAERCQANHWVSECDVFVLTEQPTILGQPTWTTVRRPSDVVAVLEDGQSDFPLIVLDIPRELPSWIRPLVARLRTGGVGLVHYVLGEDPSDEDLATWHGELGRPSVLDLASPVAPERVIELLDRGEPISSIAGMDITTELLLALRLNR